MSGDYTDVTLESMAEGAAGELFQRELDRVLENIQDPNTDAEAKRSVVLEFVIRPENEREGAKISVQASSKLAAPKPHVATMYMGERDGKVVAVTSSLRQRDMFQAQDDSVTPMPARRAQEGS